MSQHNPKLHPVPTLALAPVEVARERSAIARVREARRRGEVPCER